jgi:hypothetical protein
MRRRQSIEIPRRHRDTGRDLQVVIRCHPAPHPKARKRGTQQPEHRESARRHHPVFAARARRRGDRVRMLFAAVHESALSGHANDAQRCLLSGVKQTWLKAGVMSVCDPKRTKAGLKSRSAAGSCVLSLIAAQEGPGALSWMKWVTMCRRFYYARTALQCRPPTFTAAA